MGGLSEHFEGLTQKFSDVPFHNSGSLLEEKSPGTASREG